MVLKLSNRWNRKKKSDEILQSCLAGTMQMMCRTMTCDVLASGFLNLQCEQAQVSLVEHCDKLLVGSALCLVGILTHNFHDDDGDLSSTGKHLLKKLIVL